MDSFLDHIEIFIKPKLTDTLAAIVTLRLYNQVEIRFIRISIRKSGGLYVQPPSLRDYGHQDCFIVLDKKQWHELEKIIIAKFFEEVGSSELYNQDRIAQLKNETPEENINIDSIPL